MKKGKPRKKGNKNKNMENNEGKENIDKKILKMKRKIREEKNLK